MYDIPALLHRIGADGRKNLLQTYYNGQKRLVAEYNNGSSKEPRTAFIYRIDSGFWSAYKREMWQHLVTIDMPASKEFDDRYDDLLASVR